MSNSLQKPAIVSLLIVASLLQGLPLLVATICDMPQPKTMSRMEACCCCDTPDNSASLALSACTPGKTLAGILVTDPSLEPVKGKKFTDSLPLAPVTQHDLSAPASRFCSSSMVFDHAVFLHTISPPLFLLEHAFLI